jgi:TatA/E family protein of Tat protein translocase
MGPLGWQETLAIFVLVLLLFGPKKLPEVGKNIAKAINEFKRASGELKDTWHREMANLERETADIKKEAESLNQVTSSYTNDNSYYNYDSSYDYGYPESPESSTTSATEPSAVGASASLGADSTGTATETAQAAAAPVAAEASVPTDTGTQAPPAEPAKPTTEAAN